MSTFLELCKDTARESNTVASGLPSAVTSQTGRLAKIVYWTQQAWVRIQNDRANWRFMRKGFSKTLSVGAPRYTAAGFGITDFAEWARDNVNQGYRPYSIYDDTIGVADEGPLQEVPYNYWRQTFGRGEQTNDRPWCYAISPARELCFGPIPDKAYKLNGEYWRTAQVLTADGDIPICPLRFHQVIPWRALILLHENDEAELKIATAQFEYMKILENLERDQLPVLRIGGGPIA